MKKTYWSRESSRLEKSIRKMEREHKVVSDAQYEAMRKLKEEHENARRQLIIQDNLLVKCGPWKLSLDSNNLPVLSATGNTEELEKAAQDSWGNHYSFELFPNSLKIVVNDNEVDLVQESPGSIERAISQFGLIVDIGDVGAQLAKMKDAVGTMERIYYRIAEIGKGKAKK